MKTLNNTGPCILEYSTSYWPPAELCAADHSTLSSTDLQFPLLILDLLFYKDVMTDSVESLAELKINNIHCFSLIHSPFLLPRCCTNHYFLSGVHFLDRTVSTSTYFPWERSLPTSCQTQQGAPGNPTAPDVCFPLGPHTGWRPLMGQELFLQGCYWGPCTVACHCCCPACSHYPWLSFWPLSVLTVCVGCL